MLRDEIIAENNRRLEEINKEYDPLKGGDDPRRIYRDFPYWAAKYAYIKRKGGGDDILFTLNRPQRRLVATLEEMRTARKPIRLIVLKARQWGASTCIQLYMSWLQLTYKTGLNSLIIAHQRVATDEIKDMLDRMLARYEVEAESGEREVESGKREVGRWKLKVESGKKMMVTRVGASGSAFRIEARNCKIKVGTAERPDSCRGGDYNLIHCSEVGLWPASRQKTPEQIMRSATSGVLYHPDTLIVLESTANGTGNFFHREYEAACRGESQFRALFVPWFDIDQYSLPFSSNEERLNFADLLIAGKDSDQATSDRRQPGSYLWWLWEKGATLEAINWYVAERSKYSDHGQMAAEYPSDDVEAFVHSGAAVFDRYRVEALRAECRVPPVSGEICGDKPSGEESLKNVRFEPQENGALKMWRDVERDDTETITDRYLVAVDIGGRSALSDWSVIVVLDRKPMIQSGRPEIVAQWRGHTDFDLLAWNAARIATYYDNALLVIESNTLETRDRDRAVEGDQSYSLLARLADSYPNLYARAAPEDEIMRGRPLRYGFHTNVSTKPMVISTLVQCVRDALYIERDELCLNEYLTYERRQNGSYGALQGFHDDLLMTRAIGLHICFNEMEAPRRVNRLWSRGAPFSRPANESTF